MTEFKGTDIEGWEYDNSYNVLTTHVVRPAILGGRPYAYSADRPRESELKE